MPASRSARAITFAPRSCPSSPGFATRTRIRFSIGEAAHLYTDIIMEDYRRNRRPAIRSLTVGSVTAPSDTDGCRETEKPAPLDDRDLREGSGAHRYRRA